MKIPTIEDIGKLDYNLSNAVDYLVTQERVPNGFFSLKGVFKTDKKRSRFIFYYLDRVIHENIAIFKNS